MKKIIIIIVSILIVILLLVSLYFYGITGDNNKNKVSFTVNEGAGVREVINNLYEEHLIKSKIASLIYVHFNDDVIIHPGTYTLSSNMGIKKILSNLTTGGKYRLTLVEGRRFIDYIDEICKMFNFNKEEVLKKLSDEDYLKSLIQKYAFLDEHILNKDLYYPLEGYLYPLTYNFSESDEIEDIIEKILDKTGEILDNYSTLLHKSNYNLHEILTIASIIEKETKEEEDKVLASEVIYNRLKINMSLGMDVTTYYGARKNFNESLTSEDLNDNNPYNTRLLTFIGLPVGPICSPSASSIEAALNPGNDNYLYFYADKNGKLHFAKTYEEHKLNEEKYGD